MEWLQLIHLSAFFVTPAQFKYRMIWTELAAISGINICDRVCGIYILFNMISSGKDELEAVIN